MRFLTTFDYNLRHGSLPYGVRLMAWGLALVNIPGLLLAIVIPFTWPFTIPGALLWVSYLRMASDQLTTERARLIWILTLAYNLSLLIGTLSAVGWDLWWAAAFQAVVAGLSGIALVIMHDADREKVAPHTANETPLTETDPEALRVHEWTA